MPANYSRYLRSEEWGSIRDLVLDRDDYKCRGCGYEEDLTVHHKTYDHIFHEREHLEDLITLCKECHWKEYSNEQDLSHIPEGLLDEGVLNLADNRMYTKLYMKQIPEFSKVTYLAYWHLICHHLSRDTNMIYNPKPRKHFIEKRIAFRQICKTSKNVTYKFLKECENKGYIAEFKLQGKRYFVANPVYTLNGNKIPIKLSNLFNIRIAQRNLIYQGEEE